MNRDHHGSLRRRVRRRLLLLAALALICSASSSAQLPLKPVFGVGDKEFFKGTWMKVYRREADRCALTTVNEAPGSC